MKTFNLYNNEVTMTFDKDAPRYRYKVTDPLNSISDKPVRGVTTLLRDVIHKPELLMWPMNEAMTVLFGQEYDESTKSYNYNQKKALIPPFKPFNLDQLQEFLETGRKAHTKKSDAGKDVGTIVHGAIEHYLRTGETGMNAITNALQASYKDAGGVIDVPTSTSATNATRAFVNWWEGLAEKSIIGIENPVYSRTLQYSGTYDLIARINGKTYMLDIKTTNRSRVAPMGIYAEYFLQLAAYAYAVREERGIAFDDMGIINVGKDGKVAVVTAGDLNMEMEECERTFAYAVRLHDWLEKASRLARDSHVKSSLNPLPEVDG